MTDTKTEMVKKEKEPDKYEELKKQYEQERKQAQERIAALERMVGEIARERKEEEKRGAPHESDLTRVLSGMLERLDELSEKVETKDTLDFKKTTKALAMLIASDNDSAKSAGVNTGVNISVIKNQLERILGGEITDEEVINLVDNGWFIVKGYIFGDKGFQATLKEIEQRRKQVSDRIMDDLGDE
ncbi:MAG: hypothetical protein PHZ19_07865 [Candidatus Thermoplasmatota archaeon]|nr:hypothetical protein [Candidatus Thermoplasmatota archaeon]